MEWFWEFWISLVLGSSGVVAVVLGDFEWFKVVLGWF